MPESLPSKQPETESIAWGREIGASLVVFLVALPLCMGIAIASGVPIERGILSGAIGGILIGALAGCPLQVSGPAAGLAVMCFDLVSSHGLEALGPVVFICGIVQLAAGFASVGQWFRAVSPAVIHAMLAGIGVLIFGSQFHVMLDRPPLSGGLTNLLAIPASLYKGIFPLDGHVHHLAAMVGLATILTMVVLNRFKPKFLRALPPPLAGVLVGVGLAAYFDLGIQMVHLPKSIGTSLSLPGTRFFEFLFQDEIGLLGIAFAFVASAETLLCATAVDQLHSGPRTRYDKELIAQGIGNLTCGIFGCLPATGVIVRSTANIEAGSKTRIPAVLHGVWILGALFLFPQILEHIPRASLAAILVYTGYRLVKIEEVRRLSRYGRSEVAIYLATLLTIVTGDLLKGVILGLILSVGKLLYTFSHLEVTVDSNEKEVQLTLRGAATFVRLPALARALEQVPPGKTLHLLVDDLDYIDHACLELLGSWASQQERTGGTLEVEWHHLTQKYLRKNQALDLPGSRGNQLLPCPDQLGEAHAKAMLQPGEH
jgi:MFS superfamily sulfate permease-like transporter